MKLAVSTVVLLALVAGAASARQAGPAAGDQSVRASDEPGQGQPARDWEIRFAPVFFWAPINSTTASEGTESPPEDLTQSDSGLNAAYAGRLEYRNGPWLGSGEILYGSVFHQATDASGVSTDLDFRFSLIELYGGRELGHDLAVLGGFRHYSGTISFMSSDAPPVDRDDALLDPVVGVSWRPRLSEHWDLALSGDVGGFGVGFDLSSSETAVFTAQFSRHCGADVGYRALYMKKVDSSGTLKTTLYGPVFGFELFF
jgi:hypothetical protein